MSLTVRRRNKEAQALARRYLNALRVSMPDFAPPGDDRWLTDYALGFAAGHVGLAARVAQSRHVCAWFSKWPSPEDLVPWTLDFVPECLGLDRDWFAATYEFACRSWETGDVYAPINLGAGMGSTVLQGSLAHWHAGVQRTYFGVRIIDLDTDLRRLRAPTRLGRLTGYRSADLTYRYMVMRTLGNEVFGVSRESADQFAVDASRTAHRS